jgi:hypothetical protein
MTRREGRKFLIPRKNNREERINFVKFWADYIRHHSDKEWSREQNVIIDSQIKNVRKKGKNRV